MPQGKPGDAPEYLGEDGAGVWDEMVSVGFWLTDADVFFWKSPRNTSLFSKRRIRTETGFAANQRTEQVRIRSCRTKQNQSARR
jgi:hypothetical protein